MPEPEPFYAPLIVSSVDTSSQLVPVPLPEPKRRNANATSTVSVETLVDDVKLTARMTALEIVSALNQNHETDFVQSITQLIKSPNFSDRYYVLSSSPELLQLTVSIGTVFCSCLTRVVAWHVSCRDALLYQSNYLYSLLLWFVFCLPFHKIKEKL
jgi:hypothetical protein